MPQNPFEQNCPCCGSKNLKLGKLGAYKRAFIPEGQFMWIGYGTRAFARLACGFVGHYLYEADLAGIRNRS
jgi:hypothetical protein